jgi:hypothetical protein
MHVTEKIENVKISYENALVQTHIRDIVLDIVKAFNDKLNFNIEKIWIDIGKALYDIHIEIDCEDLYFEIKENNLIGIYCSKGLDLTNILGSEIVNKIISSIKECQNERKV